MAPLRSDWGSSFRAIVKTYLERAAGSASHLIKKSRKTVKLDYL